MSDSSLKGFAEFVGSDSKKHAAEVAGSFFSLWSAVKMHAGDKNNDTVKINLAKLQSLCEPIIASHGEVQLIFNGNDLYLNDQRIKVARGAKTYISKLIDIYNALCIGAVIIPSGVNWDDVIRFCHIGSELIASGIAADDKAFVKFQNELTASALGVKISEFQLTERDAKPVLSKPILAKQVYSRMIEDFSVFQNSIETGSPLPVKLAARSIQALIDLLTDTAEDAQIDTLLTMATFSCFRGNYVATHCTNTAVIAIAMGVKMGLSKKDLKTIGMVAYFHDIGIDDKENNMVYFADSHSVRGFNILSRLNSLNMGMMEAAMVAAKHHRNFDFFGNIAEVPQTTDNPVEEIVKIAIYYDTVTRSWPKSGMSFLSRTEAVRRIINLSDKGYFLYDAANVLLAITGLFPHGSLLKVKGDNKCAISFGGFYDYESPRDVFVLNEDYSFAGVEKIAPLKLEHLSSREYMKIPSETFVAIFGMFDRIG